MGIPISVLPRPCPDDVSRFMKTSKKRVTGLTGRMSEEMEGDSPFDKLLMYPVFLSNRRKDKMNVKTKTDVMKPILMYSRIPEKEPMAIELQTVLRNLDTGGELEKNSTLLSSLLVAQFDDVGYDVTVNYAYGFSSTTGKCYFYRQGNFEHLMSRLDNSENCDDLQNSNVSSRQIFLSYLHDLINTMTGTVWLNGYCITGPEDPEERIQVESMNVRSIPGRVTISVRNLDGIHVIRTKSRLEIYAKMEDERKKAIWFRGPFANSLIITQVENDLMSILIPAYCQQLNQEIMP